MQARSASTPDLHAWPRANAQLAGAHTAVGADVDDPAQVRTAQRRSRPVDFDRGGHGGSPGCSTKACGQVCFTQS